MKDYKVKEILILGIGNILHRDDGVGVHVVNEIVETVSNLPDNVEVFEGGTFGYDLLPVMAGRKKIVIVDALKINDKPGSVYRFPASHLTDCNNKLSLHDVGVKKIINMLMLMGECPEIEIIGIVPEDFKSFHIGITDSVKKSIPGAVESIFKAAVL
jgi:hydrogenase maturation protease